MIRLHRFDYVMEFARELHAIEDGEYTAMPDAGGPQNLGWKTISES